MTSARLCLQTVAVLTLVILVSLPTVRQQGARPPAWATDHALAREGNTLEPEAAQDDVRRGRRGADREGAAGLAMTSLGGISPLERKFEAFEIERGRRTSDTLRALGARSNAILGVVRTAQNAPVPFARVVLRNLATGLIEEQATANERGEFTFVDVIASGYVVELVGEDGSVVAASEPLDMNIADLVRATVRVRDVMNALATFGTLAPTAGDVVQTAVRADLSAVSEPATSISPQR